MQPARSWRAHPEPGMGTVPSTTRPHSQGTLTFQCGPGRVGLQVILPQAGPCSTAELLQGWAAAPAPQSGCAVVVLGDDGPTAVPCGQEQGRGVGGCGRAGQMGELCRGSPGPGEGWEASTDGAAGHVGEDPQRGRGVAGVLLILLKLWPGCGTGVRGGQAGQVIWEREGRMQSGESQSAYGSSPCGPTALLRHRGQAPALVCAPPRAHSSPGTLSVSPRAGLPHCLHWQRHQRAPTSALATASA